MATSRKSGARMRGLIGCGDRSWQPKADPQTSRSKGERGLAASFRACGAPPCPSERAQRVEESHSAARLRFLAALGMTGDSCHSERAKRVEESQSLSLSRGNGVH